MAQAKLTIEKRINAFNPYFYGRFSNTTKVEQTFEYEYINNAVYSHYRFFLDISIDGKEYSITIDGDFAPIGDDEDYFSFFTFFDGGVFEIRIDRYNQFDEPEVFWWDSYGEFEDGEDGYGCVIKKYAFINK